MLGRINDQYVKVARVKGKLGLHEHDLEDEMLLIIDGVLRMKDGGGEHVDLTVGDMHIVPTGHCITRLAGTTVCSP